MSQQQQCSVSHQHLYKKKNVDWKNKLRQELALRLRDGRQRAFNHARALKLSEHVSDDELNEAIQEFERFQDEIIQQEIESMIANEQERLKDLANADNSVLCPRCQFANLNFPDEYTLNCERCKLQARLIQPLPSPLELMIYFTKIFTSHADRECSETPTLIVQDIDKLFLRCNRSDSSVHSYLSSLPSIFAVIVIVGMISDDKLKYACVRKFYAYDLSIVATDVTA